MLARIWFVSRTMRGDEGRRGFARICCVERQMGGDDGARGGSDLVSRERWDVTRGEGNFGSNLLWLENDGGRRGR